MDRRLPQLNFDCQFSVIAQSDRSTLIAWSETCRDFNRRTKARILERIRIDRGTSRKVTLPARLRSTGCPPDGSPFVRHISVDTRRADELTAETGIYEGWLERIDRLNHRWPGFNSLIQYGYLTDNELQSIIDMLPLRVLEIRVGISCRTGQEASVETPESALVDADRRDLGRRMILESLDTLPTLTLLENLTINQLSGEEAEALAAGLERLNLRSMEISAIDCSTPYARIFELCPDEDDDSPILKLLSCMWDRMPPRSGSFPVSLRILVLRDNHRYRPDNNLPSGNRRLLVSTIWKYTNLRSLEMDLPFVQPGWNRATIPLRDLVECQNQMASGSATSRNHAQQRRHTTKQELSQAMADSRF